MDPDKTMVSGRLRGKGLFRRLLKTLFWAGGIYMLLHLLLVPAASFLTGTDHRKTSTPRNWGLPFEHRVIRGPMGMNMPGWFIPGGARKPIIIVLTGSGGNKYGSISRQTTLALHEKNYNVFLFDTRGQGESIGVKTYGVGEAGDVVRAVDHLALAFPGKKIGAVGFSLGAASVLRAAGMDERLAAVAAYASYSDLDAGLIRSEAEMQTKAALRRILPGKHRKYGDAAARAAGRVISPTLARLSIKAWSLTFGQVPSPKEAVARFGSRPLLLIHNDGDPEIPVRHLDALYAAARTPKKRKLTIQYQGHEPPFSDPRFARPLKQALQGFFDASLR